MKGEGQGKTNCSFSQTPLGNLMFREAPVEFYVIADSCKTPKPSADLIEQISYTSDNKVFRSVEFRRALIAYRKYGVDQSQCVGGSEKVSNRESARVAFDNVRSKIRR